MDNTRVIEAQRRRFAGQKLKTYLCPGALVSWCLLLLPQAVQAATYYVSTNGDDNKVGK